MLRAQYFFNLFQIILGSSAVNEAETITLCNTFHSPNYFQVICHHRQCNDVIKRFASSLYVMSCVNQKCQFRSLSTCKRSRTWWTKFNSFHGWHLTEIHYKISLLLGINWIKLIYLTLTLTQFTQIFQRFTCVPELFVTCSRVVRHTELAAVLFLKFR